VTRVAREVGTEASWAARPRCPASAGTWKDLTDCSTDGLQPDGQVRNIAEVTIAWPTGLVQKITADVRAKFAAEGEP